VILVSCCILSALLAAPQATPKLSSITSSCYGPRPGEILLSAGDLASDDELFVLDRHSGAVRPAYAGSKLSQARFGNFIYGPSLSADGSVMAFVSSPGGAGQANVVWLGKSRADVVRASPGWELHDACLTSDGRTLFWLEGQSTGRWKGRSRVRRMSLGDRRVRSVAALEERAYEFAISPTGSAIVANVLTEPRRSRIARLSGERGRLVYLTPPDLGELSCPTVADSGTVVFGVGARGFSVWSVSLKGRYLRQLSPGGEEPWDKNPTVSPSGDRVLYVHDLRQLVELDVRTRKRRVLLDLNRKWYAIPQGIPTVWRAEDNGAWGARVGCPSSCLR
jgi:hypothetical protein